jgi:hypothetical protein
MIGIAVARRRRHGDVGAVGRDAARRRPITTPASRRARGIVAPMDTDPTIETAQSVIEQAHAIARLDPARTGARAYAAAVADHVRAARVLAAPHVDPALDRAFHRALQSAAAPSEGVFVHFADGIAQLIVDPRCAGACQHRFDLLSPRQIDRRGDDPYADT